MFFKHFKTFTSFFPCISLNKLEGFMSSHAYVRYYAVAWDLELERRSLARASVIGDPGIVSGMLTPSSPLNVPAESRPGVGGGVGGGHFLPLLVCFSSDRNADSDLFSGLGAGGECGSLSISTGDCAFMFTLRSIGFSRNTKSINSKINICESRNIN